MQSDALYDENISFNMDFMLLRRKSNLQIVVINHHMNDSNLNASANSSLLFVGPMRNLNMFQSLFLLNYIDVFLVIYHLPI